ncbi:MAG TPA: FAD-dependent oxidoreductase [Actinomycetes bacterium]|nr:FAD-dependent oxidoreductase [Actinomycetes bacterium]
MTGAGVDVVVVGGGVVGCACALELAERGARTLLLERAGLAAGASGRNQGLLLPSPDPRIAPLFRESLARHEWLAGGPVPFGLRPVAQLLLAGEPATLPLLRAHADGIAQGGFQVDTLGPGELVRAEPSLAPDLAGGARCEHARALDPAAVTLAWAQAARRAGAEVRTHDAVRGLLHHPPGAPAAARPATPATSPGRVAGVVAESGPVAADAVVVAAGPWARSVALAAGVDLPVGGARGWLLQTAPLPRRVGHALEEATWPGSEGVGTRMRPPTVAELARGPAGDGGRQGDAFTLQQGPAGHATVGASLHVSLREDPELAETVHGLARRALRFVPGLADAGVVASWSGVRPVTPDGWPMVGPVPGADGLWVAAGHGPEGVMLAPPTARMLAAHLLRGEPEPDAAPFDPARLLGGPPDQRGGV